MAYDLNIYKSFILLLILPYLVLDEMDSAKHACCINGSFHHQKSGRKSSLYINALWAAPKETTPTWKQSKAIKKHELSFTKKK